MDETREETIEIGRNFDCMVSSTHSNENNNSFSRQTNARRSLRNFDSFVIGVCIFFALFSVLFLKGVPTQ